MHRTHGQQVSVVLTAETSIYRILSCQKDICPLPSRFLIASCLVHYESAAAGAVDNGILEEEAEKNG